MNARLFSAIVVVLTCSSLSGCSDKGAPPPEMPVSSASAPETAEASAAPVASASSAPADRGKEADALLVAWLDAQNKGDHAAYMALYGAGFQGVRRTADGAAKNLDRDGWSKDRANLFKGKQQVAAENVVKKVDGDRVTLTFLQRWKSDQAADHGQKVMELAVVDGALRIVREELESSERGWEDGKPKPLDATSLVSPITMTVERVRKPDNGDCSETHLRLHLVDAKNQEKQLDYGTITGMAGDATSPGGKLAPKAGEYTDLGVYCAGLQQGYSLKVVGDTIVAFSVWMDEESGPGKESNVVVTLPKGAKVTTK